MARKATGRALRATVDRIEDGRLAVLTVKGGGEMVLSAKLLPGVHEGQAFDVTFRPNPSAEKALRAEVRSLQEALLKRSGRRR